MHVSKKKGLVLNFVRLFVVGLMMVCALGANAADMRGVASVNITSDTANAAKNIAFDEARRQIISDSVRQYVDVQAFQELITNTKASDLMGLISSSSIDGEQVSDTTYSANISMVLDADAVRQWLNDNNVQNWLPDNQNQALFTAVINLSNGVSDWATLNKIATEHGIDFGTKNIQGNVVTVTMPASQRGAFTIAVRGAGWRYTDKDGELHIWKLGL